MTSAFPDIIKITEKKSEKEENQKWIKGVDALRKALENPEKEKLARELLPDLPKNF